MYRALGPGTSFSLGFVKGRVKRVKVLAVQPVGQDAQGLAESLVVDDFPLPEELDGIPHIRVVGKTQDVIVGQPGLLFRSQVFVQIRNGAGLPERESSWFSPWNRQTRDSMP